MNKNHLVKFFEGLGAHRIDTSGDQVHASCPFARWEHQGGIDKNPSFGAKASGSGSSPYNCFTCEASGQSMEQLLMQLEDYVEVPEEAWGFVRDHEKEHIDPDDLTDQIKEEVSEDPESADVPVWSEAELDPYRGEVPNYFLERGFSLDVAKQFDLGFDQDNDRLVIPIRDRQGNLVGMQGRRIHEHQECVGINSIIFSESGPRKAKDIEPGDKVWGWSEENGWHWTTVKRRTMSVKQAKKVNWGDGVSSIFGANHPMAQFTEDSFLEWEEPSSSGYGWKSPGCWHDSEFSAKGYLFGVFCGDGSYESVGSISLSVSLKDEQFWETMKEKLREKGVEVKRRADDGGNCTFRFSHRIVRRLEDDGFVPHSKGKSDKGKEWSIPTPVYDLGLSGIVSFLQGLFDSDGSLNNSGDVYLSSISRNALEEISKILTGLGIHSTVKIQAVNGDKRDNYQLLITGKDAIKFKRRVGFQMERKQKKIRGEARKNRLFSFDGSEILNRWIDSPTEASEKIDYSENYIGRVKRGDRKIPVSNMDDFEREFSPESLWSSLRPGVPISYKSEEAENRKVVDFETEAGTYVADGQLTHNCKYYNYWNFPRSEVLFGIHSVPNDVENLIVVEGPMDVMRLTEYGYHAVAILGSSPSRKQVNMATWFDASLYLMTDGDNQGRKIIKQFKYYAPDEALLLDAQCPEGTDPDDLTYEDVQECLDEAQPLEAII